MAEMFDMGAGTQMVHRLLRAAVSQGSRRLRARPVGDLCDVGAGLRARPRRRSDRHRHRQVLAARHPLLHPRRNVDGLARHRRAHDPLLPRADRRPAGRHGRGGNRRLPVLGRGLGFGPRIRRGDRPADHQGHARGRLFALLRRRSRLHRRGAVDRHPALDRPRHLRRHRRDLDLAALHRRDHSRPLPRRADAGDAALREEIRRPRAAARASRR